MPDTDHMVHTDSDGENARAFLESLRRDDLSALLSHARIEFGIAVGDFGISETQVIVRAPQPFAEALAKLPDHDRKRIAEAAVSNQFSERNGPSDIIVKATGDPVDGPSTLLPDLILHREMMIAVSTGQKQIQEVDDYYVARQVRLIKECAAADIRYDNVHASLWDWYHFWRAENMATYADRRMCERFSPGLWNLLRAASSARLQLVSASLPDGSAWTVPWARQKRNC